MSYYDGALRLVYSQITVKTGDTIAATNVETNFASNVVLPANSLELGDVYRIEFMGKYSTPGLTPPSTTAKVKLGSTAIVTTPPLSNPTGASGLGYSGFVDIVVQAVGASGSVRAGGTLVFASSTTNSVPVVVPNAVTTIDTTVNQTLQLAVLFSAATAGNSNTLEKLTIYSADAVKASN